MITTIRHDDRDDVQMVEDMMAAWRARRGISVDIGEVAGRRLFVTEWPPTGPRTHCFLIGATGEPHGLAVLRRNPDSTHTVRPIFLLPDVRHFGVGYAFYSFLINAGITLRPDTEQTLASQALWAKLPYLPPYSVDGNPTMRITFPITGIGEGVALHFTEESPGATLVDIASGKRTKYLDEDSPELRTAIEAARERFAGKDTHVVTLPGSGRKLEMRFWRTDAIGLDFRLDGEEQYGNVNLYQVVSQTKHNVDEYPYGNHPYQARLDATNWRDAKAELGLSDANDLTALLDRIGAWVSWQYGFEPAPSPSADASIDELYNARVAAAQSAFEDASFGRFTVTDTGEWSASGDELNISADLIATDKNEPDGLYTTTGNFTVTFEEGADKIKSIVALADGEILQIEAPSAAPGAAH